MKNSKVFIIGLIFIVFIWVLYLFKSFLMIMAIASLMAVATSNLNSKMLQVFKNHKTPAACATTLILFMLFFIPFIYTIVVLGKSLSGFDLEQIKSSLAYLKTIKVELPKSLDFLEPKIHEILAELDLSDLTKQALGYVSNFTKFGTKFIMDIVLICVFYFFANLYGSKLVAYIKTITPIADEELGSILSEVSNVMAVVFYSVLIVAIFEGCLFSIIVHFFGLNSLLFGVLFAFSSLIPAVGGALIYVPVAAYVSIKGQLADGLIVLFYSVLVISVIADTFIKPLIIKWINHKLVKVPTEVNELLIFFAMIAGISSFGFWGIILGPAIVTFFISMIKLYALLQAKHLFGNKEELKAS